MKKTQPAESHVYGHVFSGTAPNIGRLAGQNATGEVLVELDGSGPVPARYIKGLNRCELGKEENKGREVLLVFAEGNPEKPVIVGLMSDQTEDSVLMEIIENRSEIREARIDKKQVVIEAEDEVVLKCGKGSITIRSDGKISIRGTHLLSRSSGPHRIKGARVDIN